MAPEGASAPKEFEQADQGPGNGCESANYFAPCRGSVLSNAVARDAVNATRVCVHDLLLSYVGGIDVAVIDSSSVLSPSSMVGSQGASDQTFRYSGARGVD